MAMNWTSSYSSSPSSSYGSFLNSSMGSELDYTESESDKDDDYVAILTQQMALILQENEEDTSSRNKLKNPASSPAINAKQNDASKRMGGINKSSGSLSESDFWSKQALIDEQIKNAKQLAATTTLRAKRAYRQKTEGKLGKKTGEASPGPRSSSLGTGVFLPRGAVYASEPAEKPSGGATVIIPARVAQALKLHFDKMGVPNLAGSLLKQDVLTGDVIYGLRLQEKEPLKKQHCNPEKLLPQEWTY